MCRVEPATSANEEPASAKAKKQKQQQHPKPSHPKLIAMGQQNKSLVEAGVMLGFATWVWYAYRNETLIAGSLRSDAVFCLAYSMYLFALNYIRFDNNRLARQRGIVHTSLGKSHYLGTTRFAVYMVTAVVLSVLAPAVLLCVWPRSPPATAATPHLFVLLMQVVMEGITGRPFFHDLPRILVPLGFSIWRQFNLWNWVQMAWQHYRQAEHHQELLYALGLGLAVANLVFYSYNLFVFLIMGMSPHYLDPTECPAPPIRWAGGLWPQIVDTRPKVE